MTSRGRALLADYSKFGLLGLEQDLLSNRLRCINLGGLGKGGQSRSRPVVPVQAPPLSGRDHPAVSALVLQVRHQLPRPG